MPRAPLARQAFAFFLASSSMLGCAADPPPPGVLRPPDGIGGVVPRETNASSTPVQRHGQLHVCDTRLCGEKGEPVQLRGPSSMWLNWESQAFAEDKAGLAWMRDNWNLMVIRAAMGVEPSGAYLSDPATAKQQVETIIANAEELGVYVIVDWHDHHAVDHQAQSIAFFREMAAAHASSPNILWETFNEPEQVDWSRNLKPYHQAVVSAIRENDPDNVVILGTPLWDQSVDRAAYDPLTGDANLMYSLHFYTCTHGPTSRATANRALAAHLPIFVTEWGATDADGGTDGKVCLDEADHWLEWMDAAGISWAAWKLDSCGDSSCYFTGNVPTSGGWTDAMLGGHGPYVRDHMTR